MNVNDTKLTSLASTGASPSQGTARAGNTRSADTGSKTNGTGGGDDIHLSELVRSLRSLAADSPQRQEHLENIARTYATGNYQVNPSATAAKIIDDAIKP